METAEVEVNTYLLVCFTAHVRADIATLTACGEGLSSFEESKFDCEGDSATYILVDVSFASFSTLRESNQKYLIKREYLSE